MAATQPLVNASLAVEDDDQMHMGTSPYLQTEDYDLELGDDAGDYLEEDNSMRDDATDLMDSNSVKHDSAHQDDIMHEEDLNSYEEDLIDFDDDDEIIQDVVDNAAPESIQKNVDVQIVDHNNANQNEDQLDANDDDFIEDLLGESDETHGSQNAQKSVEADPSNTDHIQSQEATEWNEEELYEEEPINDSVEEPATDKANLDTNQAYTGEAVDHDTHEEVEHLDFALNDDNSEHEQQYVEQARDAHQEPTEHEIVNVLESTEPAGTNNGNDTSTADPSDDIQQETSRRQSSPPRLHPVSVEYANDVFPLFVPDDAADTSVALLSDISLADQHCDKLLQACREALGPLGDDDELVLEIPNLGLTICEDSRYASEITLAQVIDTYMLLSQNERLDQIEPLHCRLTHRICLQTQLAYLVKSAREGKTYSAIVEEHTIAADTTDDVSAEDQEGTQEDTFADGEDYYDEAAEDVEAIVSPAVAEPEIEDETKFTEDAPEHVEVEDLIDYDDETLDENETRVPPVPEQSHDKRVNPAPSPAQIVDETLANDTTVVVDADSSIETSNKTTQPYKSAVEEEEEDLFAHLEDDRQDDSEDHSLSLDATTADLATETLTVAPHADASLISNSTLSPATPSKSTKRKVADDEDLFDFDLTPEPKRIKSS